MIRHTTLFSLIIFPLVVCAQTTNQMPAEIRIAVEQTIYFRVYDGSGCTVYPAAECDPEDFDYLEINPSSAGFEWQADLDDGTCTYCDWIFEWVTGETELLVFEFSASAFPPDVVARYVYVPVDPDVPNETFYIPHSSSGSTSLDVDFFVVNATGRPVVKADGGGGLLEDAFSDGYVVPYDCGKQYPSPCDVLSDGKMGWFLSPIDYQPTATKREFTFASEGAALVHSAWSPTWDVPNLVLKFPAGRKLTVEGNLEAEGVTFTEAATGQGWGGIDVGGNTGYGTADFDDVTVKHAVTGVTVKSVGSTFVNSTFRENGIGIVADYRTVCTGNCAVLRSEFRLFDSFVEDNDDAGLFLSDSDVTITGTSIRYNGEEGMTLWNASNILYGDGTEVQVFERNYVEDNGTAGVYVLDNADLEMAGDDFDPGLDRVADNGSHELFVADGGYLRLGKGSIGGDNAVFDTQTPLGSSNRLIYNEPCSGSPCARRTIDAEDVYWGSASGPPTGAFTGSVDASPYLTSDPTDPSSISSRPALVEALSRTDGEGSSASRGNGELGQIIRQLRQALVADPEGEGAADLVRSLYGFQRLDHADAHGEHAQTMAVLAGLRGRLHAPGIPDAVRVPAEAALVAAVHDAVRAEDYEGAETLIETFADRVEGAQATRALALSSVSLDERAGRYAEALATLQGVIGDLGAEDPMTGALGRVVTELEAKASSEGGNRPGPAATAAAHAASGVGVAAELLPVYPNPSRSGATVSLVLAESSDVSVAVYDVLGRRVATLHEGVLEAGTSTLRFDGARLPAGVYLVRAEVRTAAGGPTGGGRAYTQRITLIR